MAKATKRRIKKGPVSIWVGYKKISPEIDILKELCGVTSYDLDSQEVIVDEEKWKQQPAAALLAELSYAYSFLSSALIELKNRKIGKALYVIAQYDFDFAEYCRTKRKSKNNQEPVYLGTFEWNDSEDQLLASL